VLAQHLQTQPANLGCRNSIHRAMTARKAAHDILHRGLTFAEAQGIRQQARELHQLETVIIGLAGREYPGAAHDALERLL
jgi:hypothetical protein